MSVETMNSNQNTDLMNTVLSLTLPPSEEEPTTNEFLIPPPPPRSHSVNLKFQPGKFEYVKTRNEKEMLQRTP